MKDEIKTFLVLFFCQMFLVFSLQFIKNPELQVLAAIIIVLVTLVICLARQVTK